MTVTNSSSGTNVSEIAAGIFRISTPIPPSQMPGGFTFNQILVVDEEPLLFHTGPRRMFSLVREAVAHVLGDVAKLRYVGFSHVEADECGSLNEWLAVAPRAETVCSAVAVMVQMNDLDEDASLRRSLHARWRGRASAHRVGSAFAVGGDAKDDGWRCDRARLSFSSIGTRAAVLRARKNRGHHESSILRGTRSVGRLVFWSRVRA